MKQLISIKSRKELEGKLASALDEKMQGLSTELQKILLDDMVTAFENRLNVLNQLSEKGACQC